MGSADVVGYTYRRVLIASDQELIVKGAKWLPFFVSHHFAVNM